MKRRTLVIAALLVLAGAAAAAAILPATCQAATPTITSLSRSEAKVGVSLTIKGRYFGASQGSSTVTFGERVNQLGFAPCAKKAKVISWTRSSIKVRVPGMAPGAHPVYVTVGGKASKRYPFRVDPVTVISGKTFTTSSSSGNVLVNKYDVLYENCTFAATNPNISGSNYGVLTIEGPFSNVTFCNCTFTGNTGPGNDGSGVNGVKMKDYTNQLIHDVTFENCSFGAFSRMGIETVEAGTWDDPGYAPGFTNIGILGCVFEPAGGEPISFNFWMPPEFIHNCLVDGCTFKGFGDTANAIWGNCLECSGQGVEWRDSEIWAGNGAAFNLEGRGTGKRSYQLFKNITVDFTHTYQSQPTNYGHRMFGCTNLSYAVWKNCSFNTGNTANHVYNAGWEGSWSSCTNNDFSGSTITGICDWTLPSGETGVPSAAVGYWDPGASQTNIWPAAVR